MFNLAAPELSFGKKCLQFKNRQFWLIIKVLLVSKQWLSVLLSVNLYFALGAPFSTVSCSFNHHWSGRVIALSYRTTGFLEISKRYLVLVIRLFAAWSPKSFIVSYNWYVFIFAAADAKKRHRFPGSFHDWLSENLETPLFGTCSLFTFCCLLAEAVLLYRSHLLV